VEKNKIPTVSQQYSHSINKSTNIGHHTVSVTNK